MRLHRHVFRSAYFALVVSYVSILLLTMSSNILFYWRTSRQIMEKTEQTKVTLLTQMREEFENSTRQIEAMANSLACDTVIYQYAKGIPDFSVDVAMERLTYAQLQDNPLLIESFLYVAPTDEVLTPTMRMDAKAFFTYMYQYREWDYAQLQESVLRPAHFQSYLPQASVWQYRDRDVQVLTYVQSFPVSVKAAPLGQVICLINAERLMEMVEQTHTATDSDVYIFDSHDNLIAKNTDAEAPDEALTYSLRNEVQNREMVFTKQTSSINGLRDWTFALGTPKTLYMAEQRNFLFWTLAICTAYLLAGIVVVRLFAERNYRPIREIRGMIHQNTDKPAPFANEFDAIKDTLQLQFADRITMQEQLDTLTPVVRKELVERLLKGMVRDYEVFAQKLEDAKVSFSNDSYCVVVVEIEAESQFFQIGDREKSQFLARLIVQNVGCELLGAYYDCEYVEVDRTECVFLINGPEKENPPSAGQDLVIDLLQQMMDVSSDNELMLYAGVSNWHKSLRNVPLCYDESRKASEYGKLRADGDTAACVSFSTLENLDYDYYFPSEIEHQIVSSIRGGDYERALELIDDVFYTNAREKNISIHAARNLLVDLGATLQKVLNTVLMSVGGEPQQKLDISVYLQNPSLDKAQVDFKNAISFIMTQRGKPFQSRSQKLVDTVESYIQEHVSDSDLDLTRLSEAFHITPQHISSIFKRYTDRTVKEYISQLRLEKAKELLCTTDLPVKQIALDVGYANEMGLIRLFKKYESMPPGEYRSLQR